VSYLRAATFNGKSGDPRPVAAGGFQIEPLFREHIEAFRFDAAKNAGTLPVKGCRLMLPRPMWRPSRTLQRLAVTFLVATVAVTGGLSIHITLGLSVREVTFGSGVASPCN
jgi:hypothetical protein